MTSMPALTFHWEFTEPAEAVTDFSLGRLTVSGRRGSFATTPRLAMMLFPTIVELLGKLVAFLRPAAVAGRARACEVSGVDSSFSLMFTRRRADDHFIVEADGHAIDTVGEEELVRAVWQGAQALLRRHRERAGANAEDLAKAERAFADAFGLGDSR
jgi:hypothetical protein